MRILILAVLFCTGSYMSAIAQTGVEFALKLSTSGTSYEVYMKPNVSWGFPQNITGTGQVSLKVPTNQNFPLDPNNSTAVSSNDVFPGSGSWSLNGRVDNLCGSGFDYLSVGYTGSRQYPYVPGQEVLLFSFAKSSLCPNDFGIVLVDNFTDPMTPPNCAGSNVGNSLVTFGSQNVNNFTGISNAWYNNYQVGAPCTVPLPLDLISFSGKVEDCVPYLEWVTINEVDVDYFLIEKSLDALRWDPIGVVDAVGNSAEIQTYNFKDPESGFEMYYRLKMVDTDESFSYSNVILLRSDCFDSNEISDIYPNPVHNTLNFSLVSSYDGQIKTYIVDALGRILYDIDHEVSVGFNTIEVDTRSFASGVYFIQALINHKLTEAKKFIKVN